MRDKIFGGFWKAFPRFRGRLLDEITVPDVEAYRNHPAGGVGKRTCDYDLGRLRRLFSLCISWGYCKENPAKGVKMFHPESRRDRFLTAKEEADILDKIQPSLRPAVVFAVNTGLRQMEQITLTWGQVDLSRRTVTITAERAKGKRSRRVPLNELALEALRSQPRGLKSETPVFPALAGIRQESLVRIFRRAVKAAGLVPKEVTWHVLRHTFASRLVQAGVNLLTVKELLGQPTLAMVMRYAHLADTHLKEAVDTLAAVSKLQITCNDPQKGVGGPQG
jgi:integrase